MSNPAHLIRQSRRLADGWMDRRNGLNPQTTTDEFYFRGYCERICEEIRDEQREARDLALESLSFIEQRPFEPASAAVDLAYDEIGRVNWWGLADESFASN